MRRQLPLIGGALAIVLMGLMVACGSEPVTRNPTGPSAPGIAGLQISGPATIPPGQSVQFTAATRLSDGTVKTSTGAQNLRWRSTNTSVLQVSTSGLVTTGQNTGEATVSVEVVGTPSLRGAREVVVIPDGTYRLVGLVADAEFPSQGIPGARVEVSGTPFFVLTDGGGGYRLLGVPPAAEIRVTASGYTPVVQSLQLTGNTTRNFQLTLSGPRLNLNGPFTLAIDVGPCSGLSIDLQHRRYDALVTTTGSFMDVVLTETSRFRLSFGLGNRFRGRVDPSGAVTFTLDAFTGGFYYYYYYPSVVERLSNNTYLVISGTATATPSNGGLSGPLNGGSVVNYDSRFPSTAAVIGSCSSAIQLTLTPR